MRYCLDTNIVSDIVRNPRAPAARQLRRVGQSDVCISIIVASELRFGILRGGPPETAQKIVQTLRQLAIMPFESPADHHYADLRFTLETAGNLIGANDLLIAAHALALGCTLVTDNEREFARVPGLVIENWLR